MGKIIKNKILGLILPLMMVLTIFIPSLKSFATSTEAKPKVQAVSNKYRVELNISHVDDRKSEGEDIKANGRQVKYFKLKESDEKKDLLEFAKRLHALPMAEVEKELGEGTLSNKSLIYDEGKLVESISPDKFDKDNTFEKIVLEDLEPGFYLIKETDESKDRYLQKLITIVEEVADTKMQDGLMIINMKKTVKNPEKSITLIKVDQDNPNEKLDKAEFKLFKKEGDKKIPVAVTGEKGSYKYDPTKTVESTLKTWDNGSLTVEELPEGEYYFEEVTPPEGYENPDNIGQISDTFKPGQGNVVVKNKRYPLLKKVDDKTSEALNGAKFKLFKKDGSPVKVKLNAKGQFTYDEKGNIDVVTTSGKGTIFIEALSDGEYYFQESEAPKGYQADTKKKYEFSYAKGKMTTQDKKPYLTIGNTKIPVKGETPKPKETPKGGYKFVKTDNTSKAKRLGGAVFQVQKIVNGKYETIQRNGKNYQVISDEKGEFSVSDLEYGDYALREIKAPVGYNPESAPIKFTIKAGSDSLPAIFIENKEVPPGTPPPPEKPPVPPTPEKPNTVIKTEKPNTIIKTDKPINTVKTDYTPSTQTTVSKIIRGPLVKTGDIRIIIMAAIGLILLIVGVKLVRSAEKPRIA